MKSTLKLAAFVTLNILSITAWAATPKMPTFFARRDYPGLYNFFVQVADTNGDGIPDLISDPLGTVSVLLGNGDGTFRTGPTTNVGAEGMVSFAPADLNRNGVVDLVIANFNSIVVTMGNGNGTFQPAVTYPINDSDIGFLVIGDFNGDGILDIATAGNTGIWLLTGKGGGTFNPAVLAASAAGAFEIAGADFNQDGNLDLVVTLPHSGGGFAVFLGNGNGTFETPQMFSVPEETSAIAVGPLTKGGPPSIALNGPSSEVYLYFGNGKGGFSGPKVVNLPGVERDGLAIGDLNDDGIGDLVSEGGYVAYGLGGGYFTRPIGYPVESAEETSNVVLADLRNNGNLDIITGGYAAISVLLNVEKGLMEDGIWTSVTGGAGCGAAADFNGDGKPDLAVNTQSGVSILLGTGKYLTPFTAGIPIALPGADCLVTGDINGDGKADLLVPVNGTVEAYLGDGNGTFTLASTTPAAGYLALGDFNHDGKLDFATSGNQLALGNGDGTFQNPTDMVTSPPDGGFSGIAVGDINNDGWPDLVLTNNGIPYNNVFVLLNNQKGGFTQVPTNFGPLTYEPILADVNGDGNLDLILSQTSLFYGGNPLGASIYLGNGSGGFTFSQTLGVELPNQTFNLVLDVNGDGIPDIGVLEGDTFEIYLGEGNATYATPFAIGTGPSPGSILVENLHGQLPTAGLPDIVETDTSGGVMVLFNLTP